MGRKTRAVRYHSVMAISQRTIACALFMVFVCGSLCSAPDVWAKRATKKQSVTQHKRSLNRLKKSIKSTRAKLKSAKKKERTTAQKLNLHRQQSDELGSYLYLLEDEVKRLSDSVSTTESSIQTLHDNLTTLQNEYADLCRRLYKAGVVSDAELVATGAPYAREARQSKYMRNITALASHKAELIVTMRDSIASRSTELKRLLDQRTAIHTEKERERHTLSQSIASTEKLLRRIRSDKSLLAKQLRQKEASAKKVDRIIATLIAKEKKRNKARSKDNSGPGGGNFTGPPRQTGGKFAKKSLPWPVTSRKVIHKFGKHTNPKTKTVTDNLGIGIKTPKGSKVRAVSSGRVSLVHWLPGYGSLVIVDHGNNFRTVYANLSAVKVKEGQKVNGKTVVGNSGASVDGEYVHFEIWRNKEKLNPIHWLH